MIGEVLLKYIRDNYGLNLDREAFLFGCVFPDYGVKFIAKPHLLKNYAQCVKNHIQGLLGTKLESAVVCSRYSRRLGIISHFYADFFCAPHNRYIPGGVSGHVKYERELWHYTKTHVRALTGKDHNMVHEAPGAGGDSISPAFIFSRFERLHSAYLKEAPGFETDLSYCIEACVEMLAMTLYGSMGAENEQHLLLAPALQAL